MKKYLYLLLIPTLVIAQSVFNPLPTAPLSIFGIPLMQKGSLLVSNGTNLGEKEACNDDEILVYDAAQVDGFKCEAKPVGGGPALKMAVAYFDNGSGNVCFGAGVTCSHSDVGDYSFTSIVSLGVSPFYYTVNIPNGTFTANSIVSCSGTGMVANTSSQNIFYFGGQDETTLLSNGSGGAAIRMYFTTSGANQPGSVVRGHVRCWGVAP